MRSIEKTQKPSLKGSSLIVESRLWYRDQYRRSLFIAIILAGLLTGSLLINVVLIFNRPSPIYFAATQDLRLAPMTPLDQPMVTSAGLMNWVSETVVNTLSLDFLHWRKKLMEVRPNYFEDAFSQLISSLKSSGILDLVTEKRLNMKTVLKKAPVLVAKGVVNGRMSWKIEFPILLSYESSRGVENTQSLIAQVLVQRAETRKYPRGLRIKQIILK